MTASSTWHMRRYGAIANDIRPQWLAALRSGKYAQGHLAMNRDDELWCPWGVHLDLAGVPIHKRQTGKMSSRTYSFGPNEMSHTVPPVNYMRRALGAPTEAIAHKAGNAIVWLNDEARLPFPEIADLIEAGNDALIEAGNRPAFEILEGARP